MPWGGDKHDDQALCGRAGVELRGAVVTRSFDRTTELYSVVVTPAAPASAVPVIETRRWNDSAEMLTYLREQVRDCGAKAAADPLP